MSTSTDYGIGSSTVYKREQDSKANSKSGKVSHDDFLKLLTKQLTTQDPLNPMQDLDFTGQLAQLQALDEQMAMTKSMQAMRLDSQMQAGTAMIGKYISGVDEAGTAANGLVNRVVQADGNIYVELANKQRVPVSGISNVWNDANGMMNDVSSSGNVIGMWVEAGYDEAKQPIKGIVEKVQVVNGQVFLTLYGGKSVTWNQVTTLRAPTEDEIYYTLPDEIRAKVEKAQGLKDKVITGIDQNGKQTSGIVAGAELDEKTRKVYVLFYDGTRVDVDSVTGEPTDPSAEDMEKALKDLWVTGLDADGKKTEGIVTKVTENDDGVLIRLDTGVEIFLDTVSAVRKPTEAEKDRLNGGSGGSGGSGGGSGGTEGGGETEG